MVAGVGHRATCAYWVALCWKDAAPKEQTSLQFVIRGNMVLNIFCRRGGAGSGVHEVGQACMRRVRRASEGSGVHEEGQVCMRRVRHSCGGSGVHEEGQAFM